MADLNKDEVLKAVDIAIKYTKEGKYKEALKYVNEARVLELKEEPNLKMIVKVIQVLSADPETTHYEILGVEETANEDLIRSTFHKLTQDLHYAFIFLNASKASDRISEAMRVLSHDRLKYDRELAVAREDAAQVAEWRASSEVRAKRAAAESRSNLHSFGLGMASMNTEPLLEAKKDEAVRAKDMAITKAYQGEYDDALKIAREAQQMDPELPDIKKLVALMKILSAPSHTTYYKLLGVKETDDATTILSAYLKLSIDVQPDQNTFPKASEAFKRIASAAGVLSDEESRAKYDHDLAAARKSAHEAARNAAAREAAAREAAAAAAREAAAQEAAPHDFAAREDDASFLYRDPVSGISYFTESFSDDSSSADTSCTDASSSDDSSTDASSTDDVGPRSKRASDTQATSTLHTPKKRREGHGPLNFN